MIPLPAVEQYKVSQRLQAIGQLRARKAWAAVQVGLLTDSWRVILKNSGLESFVSELQVTAAAAGASYGAATLAAQGLYDAPQAFVNPSAFGGFAADGRSLGGLLYAAVPRTKNLIAGGMDPAAAKISGGKFLELVTKTTIADAGRGAAGVDTFARPKTGYVRMLNAPSCSRCTVLAGKFYKHNSGFLRHPGCDCIHVASTAGAVNGGKSEGLIDDPYEYFQGLTGEDQDRIYTKAGAQAIRDGGDMFQVVNSRRGMKPGGLVTTEGTTKRGAYGKGKPPRLTPEGIYSQNLPREQTLRLLERNGYVLPGGQNPAGVIRGEGYGFTSKETLTAAQKRVRSASLDWQAVNEGRNPSGRAPLTPALKASIEDNYRKTLARRGEVFLPGD